MRLVPIDVDRARYLNYEIFCHHCGKMSTMKLLGQGLGSAAHFECRWQACRREVVVVPMANAHGYSQAVLPARMG